MSAQLNGQLGSEKAENQQEEMTLGEIGVLINASYNPYTFSRQLIWSKMQKINDEMEVYEQATRTYLLDHLYGLICSSENLQWKMHFYQQAITIVETAHRKDKKGCDVNKTCKLYTLREHQYHTVSESDYAVYTALKFVAFLARKNPDFAKDSRLMESLISAGAKFDAFDTTSPKYIKTPFRLGIIGEHPTEELNLLTPLDVLMYSYNNIDFWNYDKYNILGRRPTDPIPADLEKPAFRVFLKALYLQTEFVEDRPELQQKELNALFAAKDNGVDKALPNPLNALIFSYAAPKVPNIDSLTCIQRVPQFFINVFAIGKRFYEADRLLEANRLLEADQNSAKQRDNQRVRI